MALYEAVFISRQDLTPEGVDALTDKLSKIITEKKGNVVAKEYWGVRSLAYKINKNPRGHYTLLNIDADNEAIEELKRVSGLNEDVVRSAIFKVEEHDKEPSRLALSVNAKDYKPDNKKEVKRSDKRKEIDALINGVVINT